MQHARDTYDWDIAIYALERCAEPVGRIAGLNKREAPQPLMDHPEIPGLNGSVMPNGSGAMEPPGLPAATFDDTAFLLSDILDPNAFDFSWDALWDTPSAMTNFSI
jgi:hypothetical protein